MNDFYPIDSSSNPPKRDGSPIYVVNANSGYPGNVPATVRWSKGKWHLVHSQLKDSYAEYSYGPPTHWAPINWSS